MKITAMSTMIITENRSISPLAMNAPFFPAFLVLTFFIFNSKLAFSQILHDNCHCKVAYPCCAFLCYQHWHLELLASDCALAYCRALAGPIQNFFFIVKFSIVFHNKVFYFSAILFKQFHLCAN